MQAEAAPGPSMVNPSMYQPQVGSYQADQESRQEGDEESEDEPENKKHWHAWVQGLSVLFGIVAIVLWWLSRKTPIDTVKFQVIDIKQAAQDVGNDIKDGAKDAWNSVSSVFDRRELSYNLTKRAESEFEFSIYPITYIKCERFEELDVPDFVKKGLCYLINGLTMIGPIGLLNIWHILAGVFMLIEVIRLAWNFITLAFSQNSLYNCLSCCCEVLTWILTPVKICCLCFKYIFPLLVLAFVYLCLALDYMLHKVFTFDEKSLAGVVKMQGVSGRGLWYIMIAAICITLSILLDIGVAFASGMLCVGGRMKKVGKFAAKNAKRGYKAYGKSQGKVSMSQVEKGLTDNASLERPWEKAAQPG